MSFLQISTLLAFLGFVGGLIDAALEGTRWAFKYHEPHWFVFLCAMWLLIAAFLGRKHTSTQKMPR